jgi:amidase
MTEFAQAWPMLSRLVGDDVRKYLEFGLANIKALTLPEYIAAIAERMQVQRLWCAMLNEYDAILGPVFCDRVPVVDADIASKESNEACGRAMRLCSASSLVGCPAVSISLPVEDSLPVGVQFICAHFEEAKALMLAKEVEARIVHART